MVNKNKLIGFKITESDFLIITNASKKEERSVSSFVRNSALKMAKNTLENEKNM